MNEPSFHPILALVEALSLAEKDLPDLLRFFDERSPNPAWCEAVYCAESWNPPMGYLRLPMPLRVPNRS
jgi:hypothetical protein